MSDNQGETSTERSTDNPLLDKLSPTQFNATVKFYEADQKLTQEDRNDIANDIIKRARYSTVVGLGASTLVMFAPTAYSRIMKIQPPFVPGPKNSLRRPLLYKPLLSFLLSVATMLFVNQRVGAYQFTQRVKELEASGTKENQLGVWKAMDYHQAAVYFLYFKKSSVDPSIILQDPRTATTQSLAEYANTVKHKGDKGDKGVSGSSSWDKIRRENGFSPPQSSEESIFFKEGGNDVRDSESDFIDIDPVDPVDSKPTSAWEAIRQGKKGN